MQIVAMVLIVLVAIELAVHIVYNAITGKAGLYDAPFAYLKDLYNLIRGR